ncbi:hypothetical protein CSIV_09685 [Microbacterium sp. CSI-V]|uniref:glycoside hydrolase family 43 protein n=1 Tax=unclassified Microbacterium TaxID=2609290 RepID=UPI00097CBD3C|nr:MULTISPECIES: glycoside hydrolase family 43 protein [unclassified Microbacterium]MXS75848.1 glycoside hydrolase family 43 protein [Microbacterium sp. TL13]ONI65211.1 hypothetical protein CSIV_09685 [Microbacterium sp. CSI-V]
MTRDAATTPVIPGFFPDPSVCRVGEDYFLVNSSFEYAPGIPIHRSRDLRTWTQIGNVLTREVQFPAGVSGASRGIYAPTIRHRDGTFFVVVTNVERGDEQFVVTATDPAGPWSDPIVFPGLGGIDPDLAWDDDGRCVLTYCALDEGLRPEDGALPVIAQVRVDLDRGVLLDEPRVIWRGSGLAHPEGPHLYRRGEWWYLLTAEGGTERGHAVCVARSRAIDGPFEAAPANPIFSRRSTGFPVQNTGHADLVEQPDGSWAMVYLGVRPRGFTPGFHVAGRETFLARVAWVDDWPVVHTDDVLLERPDTAFTDDFSTADLHPRWVSPDGPLPGRHPAGGVAVGPHELAVRVRDLRWRFEARVDSSAAVALRVRLDEHHWYAITLQAGTAEVRARIGPLEASIGSAPATGDVVTLLVEAVDATHDGPDDLRFGVLDADGERWIAALDGRYLSTEVAGGFTGRVLGLRAVGSTPAQVTGVRYVPLGDE